MFLSRPGEWLVTCKNTLHIRKHMNYIYINPSISTCLKQNIDWLRTFPSNSFLPEPNKAPLRKQFECTIFPPILLNSLQVKIYPLIILTESENGPFQF